MHGLLNIDHACLGIFWTDDLIVPEQAIPEFDTAGTKNYTPQ